MNQNILLCRLCNQTVASHPIHTEQGVFCCHGCQAVHAILLSKNELENFVEHPLFQRALKSGLISNPDLIAQIQNRASLPHEKQKMYFEITDLWCPSCAEVIRLVLLQNPAISQCAIDYATDLASVEFSLRHISKEAIFDLIRSLGYTPGSLESEARPAVGRSLYLRFIVAAFCALNVMMFAYPLYATYFDYDPLDHGLLFAWLSGAMSLPVVTYCAWPILRRFFNSLKVGVWGMEALIVCGVGASLIVSVYELFHHRTRVYFDSMTVVIAFVLLGKILESKAKFSTRQALLCMNRSVPKRGRKRFSDGTQRFVPIKEIIPKDFVTVLAGEKIVLDGLVVEGSGFCDESLMTGESLPVMKIKGSSVLGGSILQQGELLCQVTALAEESMLHRMIDMVAQDIGHKSFYTRAVDPLMRWFVPFALALAASTALFSPSWEEAFLRGLSVVLISCPCAIGIAAPLVESYLMHALAGIGVLVRNRACLAYLGKETHYVFDKTGTITEGAFTVLSGLEILSKEQLQVLKGMTARSNHLIAVSVSRAIPEEAILVDTVEVLGKGLMSGVYFFGSRSFLEENGIPIPDHKTEYTTVYFAENGCLLTVLQLGDRIRAEAHMVSRLSSETMLLSGDSEGIVEKVARECGFRSFQHGQTPAEKRARIEELKRQGAIVCMVGDGMNDAPSLAAAHVGISVVSASDLSVQASDILLTTPNLSVLQKMEGLARKGRKIVSQNLFWAFFYNLIGIGLAFFGLLSPIFSTFAMMISSLIVIFNSRRIKL